jgi:DNA-binding protein HU-beta
MTKAEAIISTATIAKQDKAQTETVVTALLAGIVHALECGNAVFIPEFGTFYPLWRNETTGRLIKKNTTIIVPGHSRPHFKPYKQFKNTVRMTWQSDPEPEV